MTLVEESNWSSVTNSIPKLRTLNHVFFLNANEGWTVGFSGAILHATDGGANWQVVADGLVNTILRRIFFTSSTNGFIAGNQCTLLKYGEMEPGVATLPTATNQGYMTVEVTGCESIGSVRAYREGESPLPQDVSYNYPYGLVVFEIPCASATVTIHYHGESSLAGSEYRK